MDCLKYFTVVEHLDNYRCDQCWHITASKYLSLKIGADEVIMFYLMSFNFQYNANSMPPMFFVMKFHFATLGMTTSLISVTGKSKET